MSTVCLSLESLGTLSSSAPGVLSATLRLEVDVDASSESLLAFPVSWETTVTEAEEGLDVALLLAVPQFEHLPQFKLFILSLTEHAH